MTQVERDRLVTLRKLKKGSITQAQAAEELGVTTRQVRRLLVKLKEQGDKAVIHGLRGRPSNRRLDEQTRQRIVEILKEPVYRGFGPTLASEHLWRRFQIRIGREALRGLMKQAGLWRAKARKAAKVHTWRPRRSRFGEMVQWDSSDHDWLEGRGERITLIHLIDDASSRLRGRFVRHDSTVENLRLGRAWVEEFGRPGALYMDKASIFRTAEKRKRDQPGVDQDPVEMPPTQFARAMQELGIPLIFAHSAPAKGRVERSFQTAQDRLVKELRVAGACTVGQANQVWEEVFLPWWEANCTVVPAHPDDAHRRLGPEHNLDSIFSVAGSRKLAADYTFRFQGKLYRIEPESIRAGMRGGTVRIEQRLDGSMAVVFHGRFLLFAECPEAVKQAAAKTAAPKVRKAAQPSGPRRTPWMDNFQLKKGLSLAELARRGLLNR